jgi:hypothetical protein
MSLQIAARNFQAAQNVADWTEVWAPAASVATVYYGRIGQPAAVAKEGYRAMLEGAVNEGYIESGQRDLAVPKIRGQPPVVVAAGTEAPGAQLSLEKYMRATDKALMAVTESSP